MILHMLTGKAIARAVRAHFIVDAALNALLITSLLVEKTIIEPIAIALSLLM